MIDSRKDGISSVVQLVRTMGREFEPRRRSKPKFNDMTTEDLKEIFADKKPFEIAIIVSGFTGHRTTLLEELTPAEAEKLLKIYRPAQRSVDEEFNALKEELLIKEWRSKILANAEKAGIKEPGGFHKFNNWMLNRSMCKKQLTAYTLEELRALSRQIHGVITNNGRSAQRTMTKAWWKKAEQLKGWN